MKVYVNWKGWCKGVKSGIIYLNKSTYTLIIKKVSISPYYDKSNNNINDLKHFILKYCILQKL